MTTNPDSSLLGGATVGSNNTAELQAVVKIFNYFLLTYQTPPYLPTRVCLDSQYVLDILQGLSCPTTHIILVSHTLQYWEAVKHRFVISIHKVPAHYGVEGNEIADRGATRGYRGQSTRIGRFAHEPVSSLSLPCIQRDLTWFNRLDLGQQYWILQKSSSSAAAKTFTPKPKTFRSSYISASTWDAIQQLHSLTGDTPLVLERQRRLQKQIQQQARRDEKFSLENRLLEDFTCGPADKRKQTKSMKRGYQNSAT